MYGIINIISPSTADRSRRALFVTKGCLKYSIELLTQYTLGQEVFGEVLIFTNSSSFCEFSKLERNSKCVSTYIRNYVIQREHCNYFQKFVNTNI